MTSTEKQKRIYTRKRTVSCFSWLDMKAIAQKNLERKKQKVTQYYKTGKSKRSFPSIKEAAEYTGISRSNISAVLKGAQQTAGGFVWRKGNSKRKINLEGYFDQWKVGYKEKRGIKIKQVSKNGKTIKVFPSITDAARADSITFASIWRALKKPGQKQAGGSFWHKR